MSLVYLYAYKLPVQLSMTDNRAPNYNRPMYNYNVSVYKNNYNIIDFVVRNNDRKQVKLVDCKMSVIITHVLSQTVVLEKGVQITDEVNGRAQLVLTADDVRNWSLGGYQYNIKLTKPNRGQEFLYTDINSNAVGVFELFDAVGGDFIPSSVIKFADLTNFTPNWDAMGSNPAMVSGAIPASNQIGNTAGLFSIAVYQNKWMGKFKLQGSLDNLSPTDRSWFDVEIMPGITDYYFDGTTSLPIGFSFSMNLRWIRFVVIPSPNNVTGPDITNNTINSSTNFLNGVNISGTIGIFDKIIYKIS